jgi:hypothetical protein
VEAARHLSLDLPEAHATGRLRLLRIPPAQQLAARGPDGLEKAFEDFRRIIRTDRPDRVVVEDFTPMVQFDTFERFRAAFQGLLDEMVSSRSSLLIGLGEPGNDASRRLLDVVGEMVAGVLTLRVSEGHRTLVLHQGGAQTSNAPTAPFSTSDGASVQTAPIDPGATANQELPEPPTAVAPPLAAQAQVPSGIPVTEIIPPPAPDPDLLRPGKDTFGADPADGIVDQGYLIDSHAGRADTQRQPAPQTAPPSFAPLGGGFAASAAPPPSDASDSFKTALTTAYGNLPYGTPFLVVAVRMEPTAPEAADFDTVAAGLRSALRPEDHILVDNARKRAAVLLPDVGPEAVQPLYGGLQAHLRLMLGDRAETVLQAVGAVSVPNGQPFLSATDLLTYAIDS